MAYKAGLLEYNETEHGGLQAGVTDGLHPVVPGLEVVVPPHSSRFEEHTAAVYKAELEVGGQGHGQKKRRFSRKCMWISIVVLVIVIAAAVGGGVGGSMASNSSSDSEQTPQGVATTTSPTYSATSVASAYPTQSTLTSTVPAPTGTPSVFWGSARGYYEACYVDDEDRILRGPGYAAEHMTQEVCAGLCDGYPLFGLENGRECWCGDTLVAGYDRTPETSCDYVCQGNSSQSCGGFWAISVFVRDPAEATVAAYDPEGCVVDSESRVLAASNYTVEAHMTTELCAGLCSAHSYFGLEVGNQCYCGDELTANVAAESAMCNVTCAGDSTDICGGVWHLDLYSF